MIKNILKQKFDLRKVPKNSTSNFDTFIFFVRNKKEKIGVLRIINKNNFGTKNLPDAIQWHCSFFWDHIFNKVDIKKFKKTKELLNHSIAIPILLNKKLSDYEVLSKDIANIR